jgi:hypothetical protein
MEPSHGALTAEDLMTLERYARERAAFRARVLEHKRDRTIAVGPSMTWVFEDRLTIQYQVQEMLRIERMFEPEGIQEELDAYNPLIPDGGNWKATMMIEYPDPAERAAALAGLRGIEDLCYVAVDGQPRAKAIADRTSSAKTRRRPRRCTGCASRSRAQRGMRSGRARLSSRVSIIPPTATSPVSHRRRSPRSRATSADAPGFAAARIAAPGGPAAQGSAKTLARGRDRGEIRPWQGARSVMYPAIHERRATQPGTNFARSLRVTRGPLRDFVARLAHRLSYGALARALSRQGARVTRSTCERLGAP